MQWYGQNRTIQENKNQYSPGVDTGSMLRIQGKEKQETMEVQLVICMWFSTLENIGFLSVKG